MQLKSALSKHFDTMQSFLRVVGGADINVMAAPWHSVTTGNNEGVLLTANMLGGCNLITVHLVLTGALIFWLNSKNCHVCPTDI